MSPNSKQPPNRTKTPTNKFASCQEFIQDKEMADVSPKDFEAKQ